MNEKIKKTLGLIVIVVVVVTIGVNLWKNPGGHPNCPTHGHPNCSTWPG
jgi:hypothetical protein